jgi:uncharacterized membrane protein
VGEEAGPPSSEQDSLPPANRRPLSPRTAGGRLTLSIVTAVVATLFTSGDLPLRIRAVVGWDTGALLFVVLAWTTIARATPEKTRARAGIEDPGRRLVFVVALAASLFSLFAAVVVMREIRQLPPPQVPIWTTLALVAVVLSWVVTHTAFTLRYAHLYYRRHSSSKCFQFPGTDAPSDLDFAYFAFTIGMCFQVSDVVVMSSRARRAVLLHAVMSFLYNTTMLALALNLVTTLLG